MDRHPHSAGSSCRQMPIAPVALNRPTPDGIPDVNRDATGRYISANHKTGTALSLCLVRVLAAEGIQLHRASMHTWGYFSLKYPNTRLINMVRNPFILVHSGYLYHRGTTRPESWTLEKFSYMSQPYGAFNREHTNGVSQGALAAVNAFRTCSRTTISENATYREALNTLSLSDGLLLESLRSLHRDIPYMVSSALACYHAARSVKSDPSVTGTCTNVLLEAIMANYTESFVPYVAEPLQIKNVRGAEFARDCDPALTDGGRHRTSDHSERSRAEQSDAIHAIRKLDHAYLDGMISIAERTMQSLGIMW